MKISETFLELNQKYPERKTNSPGLTQVMNTVKELGTASGINVTSQKIPVYNFHLSLLIYILASLATIVLSFFHPPAGFGAGLVLYLLLLNEIIRPVLARVKTRPGENLLVTIPARSKEIQKILVIADLSTESFIEPPPRLSSRSYLIIIFSLGLGTLIFLGLNCLFAYRFMAFAAILPLLGIIYFKIFGHTVSKTASLSNCAIMSELAQILSKDRPFRTSVSFLFTGSGSLNSGVLKVSELLNPKLNFIYVVELINQPDKRINIVTADGLLFTLKNQPLLVELFMGIARAKNIPVQEIKLNRITGAHILKSKKINTISLTNPLDSYTGTDPQKDLRELIIGLIRQLDHPE